MWKHVLPWCNPSKIATIFPLRFRRVSFTAWAKQSGFFAQLPDLIRMRGVPLIPLSLITLILHGSSKKRDINFFQHHHPLTRLSRWLIGSAYDDYLPLLWFIERFVFLCFGCISKRDVCMFGYRVAHGRNCKIDLFYIFVTFASSFLSGFSVSLCVGVRLSLSISNEHEGDGVLSLSACLVVCSFLFGTGSPVEWINRRWLEREWGDD